MTPLKRFISVIFILNIAFLSSFAQEVGSNDAFSPQPSPASSSFIHELDGNLVELAGYRLQPYPSNQLSEKQYILLYFSAQWCPACRVFTPRLKAFYENARKMHDNFEVIFISNDRSEQEMLAHIQNTKMPWPAVNYSGLKNLSELQAYGGPGIPCLVLLDNQGNVLSHAFQDSDDSLPVYIGPEKVVVDLGNRLLSEAK